MSDWLAGDNAFESETQFIATSDPRVVAVIMRDPYYDLRWMLDGDCIQPVYYREYWRSMNHVGGRKDDYLAQRWLEAIRRFVNTRHLKRYMRIFHETVVHEGLVEPGDRSGEYVVFTTLDDLREWRSQTATIETALEDGTALAKEIQGALDGDVWTIAYAINEGRRLGDGPLNWEDFTVAGDTCSGFVGEAYAKREAILLAENASLPEMLEV